MNELCLNLIGFNNSYWSSTPREECLQSGGMPFIGNSPPFSITPPQTIFQPPIPDECILESDQQLIDSLPANLDPQNIPPALANRIIECLREHTLQYTGWERQNYLTPESAFLSMLEQSLGRDIFEEILICLLSSYLPDVLTVIEQAEADQLLTIEDFSLSEIYSGADEDARRSAIGTNLKIMAFRRVADLRNIMLARGISPDNWQEEDITNTAMPGITAAERLTIAQLSNLADNPNDINDSAREQFVTIFRSAATGFLTAPFGTDERMVYVDALQQIHHIALPFGFNNPALDTMFASIRHSTSNPQLEIDPLPQQLNLEELDPDIRTTIGPANLPDIIFAMLQATNYYNLVANNVREIVFTRIENGFGGAANSFLRLIRVNAFPSFSREPQPAWSIAATIVHESAHIAWSRSAPGTLQQVTAAERHAYLVEANFLASYLRLSLNNCGTTTGSQEAIRIARTIVHCLLAAVAANRALGYAEDNLDPYYYTLPSNDFLAEHNLSGVDELDMTSYPPFSAPFLVIDSLSTLIDALDLAPEESRQVKILFKGLLSGEIIFDGTYDSNPVLLAGYNAIYRALNLDPPDASAMFSANDIINPLFELLVGVYVYGYLAHN